MKKSIVFILAFLLLWSCSSRSVRQEYAASKNLYVGWLDLKPDNYRNYGYPTRAEWEKDIADLNTGFQKFVADYLKDFNVTGARKIGDRYTGPGYTLALSNVVIDPQTSIVADVTIRDAATGKLVKQFASYGTSFHMSYSMYTFAGRLNNACYALAYEIYMQMTE
jgi:hypothetical protein